MLRGIVEIDNSASETDVQEEIGKAARLKYDILTNNDFKFLRATRRVLSKPFNSGAYDFKQVKMLAGQGSLYMKLKDNIYCLLERENFDDKEDDTSKLLLFV